jgi:hypothetical protein
MRPKNKKTCTSLQVTSLILSILLAFLTCTVSLSAQAPGIFTPTGNMMTPRSGHNATLLLNGKVLITGGSTDRPASAELFDPVTGTFSATGDMTRVRSGHTATLLPDGRVLIAGGYTAELYDPTTGTFTAMEDMVASQHYWQSATVLNNGKVLIAGGGSGCPNGADGCAIVDRPELYDPVTGTFAVTGDYADKTGDPWLGTAGLVGAPATLLPDGEVLIAAEPTAELYNPAAGTFGLTGQMTRAAYGQQVPGWNIGGTAILLTNGKVLLVGGEYFELGSVADAELYDPSTGKFTRIGNMTRSRYKHTATLLRDGTVLIAGNLLGPSSSASSELYDPVAGTFGSTADMTAPRASHTATLLMDGRILITGGWDGLQFLSTAEIYNASRLIPTPVVTDLRFDRTNVVAGTSYSVNVSGTNITAQTFFDVRFIAPGSGASDVVLNWQRGVGASHDVSVGTAAGIWTINGVRPHQIETDHTGGFIPVLATITVSP